MQTRRSIFILCLFLLASPASLSRAQEDSEEEKAPVPPESFPAAYKDSEILTKGVSPDGRYGLIYPKYELSADVEHPQLLLVELKPFRVVTEISRDANLEHGHNSYAVEWAKDSSAVLIDVEAKWGPGEVLLVPIRDGRAGRVVDLTAEVRKIVTPDYKKSKAARFNDYFDFIFDASYYLPVKGKRQAVEQRWSLAKPGQVDVLCFCTTDPKDMEEHSWSVQFNGTWNISRAEFTRRKMTRVPSGQKDGLEKNSTRRAA